MGKAIDGLFSSGRFKDIVVQAEKSGLGVIVRFVTQTQLFVGGIDIEGKISSPPNRGELNSDAQFTLGTQFQEEDVTNAVNSLARLLKSNGLYEAQVTPRIEPGTDAADPQQIFVTFDIKEGKRAKYDTPVIQGNRFLSNATIVRATGWRIPIIHWWLKVSDARTHKGISGVQSKYESKNRLTAKVELGQLDYNAATRRVTPHLTVNPGPRVKVTAVEAKVSQRILKRYVPVFQGASRGFRLARRGQAQSRGLLSKPRLL